MRINSKEYFNLHRGTGEDEKRQSMAEPPRPPCYAGDNRETGIAATHL